MGGPSLDFRFILKLTRFPLEGAVNVKLERSLLQEGIQVLRRGLLDEDKKH